MFCKNCGKKIKANIAFCPKCGNEVGNIQTSDSDDQIKKKSYKGLIVGASLIVVAIILAVIVKSGVLSLGSDKKEAQKIVDENSESSVIENKKDADTNVESAEQDIKQADNAQNEIKQEENTNATTDWKQVYIDYIENSLKSEGWVGFELIYINEDDIPEIFTTGNCEAMGHSICSYYDGKVYQSNVSRIGGFSYIEKENICLNSNGNMGVYADIVYQLNNGQLQEVISGESGMIEDNSNPNCPEEYSWDGTKVTEEEYKAKLQQAFDSSRAIDPSNNCTVEELISQIENYDGSAEPKVTTSSSDYILPNSNSVYLTKEVLSKLNSEELRIARNEIYARHGYIFTTEDMIKYFEGKSWYTPSISEVPESMLNEYEIANRDLILSLER